jgi:hypothetical protein
MDDNDLDYEINRESLPNEISSEETKSCGSTSFIWIILLIILLLLLIAVCIWFGVYYYHNKNKCEGCTGVTGCDSNPNRMNVTGVRLNITSDTSVSASWNATSRNTDNFILYASLDPPIQNQNGEVTNFTAKGTSVTNGATTATITGLQHRLKYYITLVGTNTLTSNYFTYTQIIYMQSGNIPAGTTGNAPFTPPFTNTFSINDIIQTGKIQVLPNSGVTGTYQVEYTQFPLNEYSIFILNSKGQIQLDNPNLDSPGGLCLVSSGATGTLIAQECTTASTTNSYWTYSPTNYPNQWCLTSSVSINGATGNAPTCMAVNGISAQGVASINVTNNSTPGDAWSISYQS